jgi:hypothetical protein
MLQELTQLVLLKKVNSGIEDREKDVHAWLEFYNQW